MQSVVLILHDNAWPTLGCCNATCFACPGWQAKLGALRCRHCWQQRRISCWGEDPQPGCTCHLAGCFHLTLLIMCLTLWRCCQPYVCLQTGLLQRGRRVSEPEHSFITTIHSRRGFHRLTMTRSLNVLLRGHLEPDRQVTLDKTIPAVSASLPPDRVFAVALVQLSPPVEAVSVSLWLQKLSSYVSNDVCPKVCM